MKNLTKVKFTSLIIAIAAIVVFAAVSCAPVVEPTDYDWSAVNAQNDPTRTGGNVDPDDYAPSITDGGAIFAKDTDGNDTSTVIGLEIDVTFPSQADVLRGEITAASLDFLSFWTFKNASPVPPPYTASPLVSSYSFTVENRKGNTVTLKITINPGIDMSAATAPDGFVMRVDGKKYTYSHGLKLDIDRNGKIESPYDDWYDVGYGNGYVEPGQRDNLNLTLPGFPTINTRAATWTLPNPLRPDDYFNFIGTATTTNPNTYYVTYRAFNETTSAAEKAYYNDLGGAFARNGAIKLQKLNGATWTDVKAAVYDSTVRNTGSGIAVDTTAATWNGNTHFVFSDISFEHGATYRIIWEGSAYTETTYEYYGVKQRVYVGTASNAARYTRTIVLGNSLTVNNSNVINFTGGFPDAQYSRYSYDSDDKNNVLKIELSSMFWSSISEADFIKSFKVVYSRSGTPGNTDTSTVEVDIKSIKFADERPTGSTPAGNNVVYITLDPNVQFTGNAQIASRPLYFKVNNGISISNNASTPTVRYFGTANGFYENFAYYPVSTITAPPPAPTGVGTSGVSHPSVALGTGGQITVGWNPVTDADYYYVHDNNSNSYYVSGTSYLVTGLEGGSYSFYVVAWKDGKQSSPSSNTPSVTLNISLDGTTWVCDDTGIGGSGNMYTATFTTNGITLDVTGNATATETGTYSASGNTVTFTPTGGQTYFNAVGNATVYSYTTSFNLAGLTFILQ